MTHCATIRLWKYPLSNCTPSPSFFSCSVFVSRSASVWSVSVVKFRLIVSQEDGEKGHRYCHCRRENGKRVSEFFEEAYSCSPFVISLQQTMHIPVYMTQWWNLPAIVWFVPLAMANIHDAKLFQLSEDEKNRTEEWMRIIKHPAGWNTPNEVSSDQCHSWKWWRMMLYTQLSFLQRFL